MRKREWALLIFVYLALAEVMSWHPVPDSSLCLIQTEHSEQSANHNGNTYCPAFHTGIIASLDALDGFLERHDKSVVGGFTIVLAISTIGLWLATNKLWKAGENQLDFLRESTLLQYRDMQTSIAVAHESAKAAHRSASVAESALVDLERPYMLIGPSEIKTQFVTNPPPTSGAYQRGDPMEIVAKVDLRNAGRSPAFIAQMYGEFRAVTWLGPQPDYDTSKGITYRTDIGMGPGDHGDFVHDFRTRDIREQFFFGYVLYRDIFQNTHTSRFCMRIYPATEHGGVAKRQFAGKEAWRECD